MDTPSEATKLVKEGRFVHALAVLESPPARREQLSTEALRCEVLERLGKAGEARGRVERLLRNRALASEDRSLCLYVLGRIEAAKGNVDSAIANLQKSVAVAIDVGAIDRIVWAQLRLFVLLSASAGPEAMAPLLAELRANAINSGDPRLLAAVHLFVGQTEAQRGLLSAAERHLALASSLLQTAPNVWLSFVHENVSANVAVLKSDFDDALSHAHRSEELSIECGDTLEHAVTLSNLGFVLYLSGQLDSADAMCERALNVFPAGSDNACGAIETLARIRLAQGRMRESEELINRIRFLQSASDRRSAYVHRHSLLIQAQLRVMQGDIDGGLTLVDQAVGLSKKAGDDWLLNVSKLTRLEFRPRPENDAVLHAFLEIGPQLSAQPPDVYALYERVAALALVSKGLTYAALEHKYRAERIYGGTRRVIALNDFQQRWEAAIPSGEPMSPGDQSAVQSGVLIQAVCGLAILCDRPELMAHEALAFLTRCDWVLRARLESSQEGAPLESEVSKSSRTADPVQRRISVGCIRDRELEIVVEVKRDIESLNALNSFSHLINALVELRGARHNKRDKSSLWPAEEPSLDFGQAVVSGHMAGLMTLAQRVARTNVNVLITGESGTGKEIIARALHDFSGRAQKPFVPFNCAAVPRDLIESQLFGHRRGAFTGAERDHLGLIRAAADGTLFLDEVGEMSLDLQPKLLRFLESGEISPLGEPLPSTVNVRVVAATNSNLEDAVRDGRFREDLFYRLNVVRLSIRPLRERRDEIPGMVNHFVALAARDYKKGHLQVAEETMERLLLFRWPGNVRQLQNEIRRMVALADPNSTLEPDAISLDILGAMPYLRHAASNGREIAVPLHDKLLPTLSRIEYEMIKAALREHRGKLEPAARSLGISRKGLYLKRQRLGL